MPESAPRWSKLGVIAGGGALPVAVAAACAARDAPVFVLRLAGLADPEAAAFEGAEVGIAEAGTIIRTLRAAECDAVTLVGAVRRPDFSQLKPDWRGAALLPRVLAAAAKGDAALLDVLVDTLEAEGFRVVGADEAAAGLVASRGAMGAHAPGPADLADIRRAAGAVAALGAYDVGQGAVCAGSIVLALEAAEGTDAMLDRVAALPAEARGAPPPSGALVKRPKPRQELRVDLPTVGLETIRRAAAAGLAGVAVEAGRALFLDRPAALAEADARGLFVYGFTAEEVAGP